MGYPTGSEGVAAGRRSTQASPLFLREPGRPPLRIVRGEGAWLIGEDGRRYLDAAAGAAVACLGHGRADVAEVLREQASRLAFAHPSKFVTREAEELAEKLVARAPAGLDRVLFTSGGSEATETAIKLARQVQLARGHGSRTKVVTRRTSYHGATLGALAVSGQAHRRQPFTPMMLAQPMIAPTSCYRCPFGKEPGSCDVECASDLETALLHEGPENVAAFIAEPIVGSSAPGRHPPQRYWPRVREICDRYGVLLIADEVMSGNGRSGRWWAMQHTGVVPDLMTTAKGLSAGYSPLGAVLVRDEYYQALKGLPGAFRHGHTFAGNPLSCAVGSHVVDVLEREGLIQRAGAMGALLKRRLEEELGDHPHVGVIRGRGLLLGVEFVADRATRAPFAAEADVRGRFARACLDEGVYVYQGGGNVDGRRGDHALLAPPFVIREDEIEILVAGMAAGLARVTREVAA
ncbi:MAG: aspartate aminotransferase family protein [Trueperaceae bacterium]|nr:aspartate aminotransferase family protein [Trueperaceae bacterium]